MGAFSRSLSEDMILKNYFFVIISDERDRTHQISAVRYH